MENAKDKALSNKISQTPSHSKQIKSVGITPKSNTIQNVICGGNKDQAVKPVSSNCLGQSKVSTIFCSSNLTKKSSSQINRSL